MEKTPYLFVLADANSSEDKQRNTFVGFSNDNAAPVLLSQSRLRPGNLLRTDLSTESIDLINVIKDFEWTHTPTTGRKEVPFIRLSEYRVNFNSLLQNIRYLLAFSRAPESQPAPNSSPSQVSSAVNKIADFLQGTVSKAINSIPVINKLAVDTPSDLNQSSYLHPYYGLYGASPTGFNYYFPYFEDTWKDVSTSWGDVTEGGGIFSPIIKELFDTDGITKALGSLQINPNILGTYIERPKMYSYGGEGPTTTFKITLLNTNNFEDVVRNWHLCFLLSYQNLPNKTSKVLLEPPVIYEVEVPGVFYSPFAYIRSLRITNRGSTRVVELPYLKLRGSSDTTNQPNFNQITSDQGRWDQYRTDRAPKKNNEDNAVKVFNAINNTEIKKIETIIPEAYDIEITLQSLIPESKNLFYHSILGVSTLNSGIYTAAVKDPSMREATTAEQSIISSLLKSSKQNSTVQSPENSTQ